MILIYNNVWHPLEAYNDKYMDITITLYAFNTEPITLVYIHETKMCFNGQDFIDNHPYWIKRLMHEIPVSDQKIQGIIQNLENIGYNIKNKTL